MPFIKRSEKQEKPDYKFGAEYMGGHKAFAKKRDTDVLIFRDRITLNKLDIDIPFSSMTNIENSDAERLTKTRMFLTPFFLGFFWKKKYLYTVIDYHDGIDNQSLVLDLHRAIEKAQAVIYQRMLSSKKDPQQQKDSKYIIRITHFSTTLMVSSGIYQY